jgi:sec-independent protein translocase protein TatC
MSKETSDRTFEVVSYENLAADADLDETPEFSSQEQSADSEASDDDQKRMPLVEHLRELRTRLIRASIAFVVASLIGWMLFGPIMSVLLAPLRSALGDPNRPLIAIGVFDPVGMRLKVAAFAGLVLALPVISWQIWRFVAPGLTKRERRTTVTIVAVGSVLFAFGVAVAYLTAVPALSFLLRVAGNTVEPLITADRYISFLLTMALGFGAAFQFPLALVALVALGAVESRQLLKAWRIVVVVIAVVAAVATPGQDPFSFLALFVPMCIFYLVAVGFARFVLRK